MSVEQVGRMARGGDMSFPAPRSSVGVAFSDTRGEHGSLLTSSCVSQQLLLEDNMNVEQVGRMARWGDMSFPAPRSSVGVAFSDTRGEHGSLLTSSCVS